MESNVTPKISMSKYQGKQTPSSVTADDWVCIVRDMHGNYLCLSLTRIQFLHPKVTPLTNLSEVKVHGLSTETLNPRDSITVIKFKPIL